MGLEVGGLRGYGRGGEVRGMRRLLEGVIVEMFYMSNEEAVGMEFGVWKAVWLSISWLV